MRPCHGQLLQPGAAVGTYNSGIERNFGSHRVWQESKCALWGEYNVGRRVQLRIRACTDTDGSRNGATCGVTR